MKAIRLLTLLCACFALTLAIGCSKDASDDTTTEDTGASQPDANTEGGPKLEGAGEGGV